MPIGITLRFALRNRITMALKMGFKVYFVNPANNVRTERSAHILAQDSNVTAVYKASKNHGHLEHFEL